MLESLRRRGIAEDRQADFPARSAEKEVALPSEEDRLAFLRPCDHPRERSMNLARPADLPGQGGTNPTGDPVDRSGDQVRRRDGVLQAGGPARDLGNEARFE